MSEEKNNLEDDLKDGASEKLTDLAGEAKEAAAKAINFADEKTADLREDAKEVFDNVKEETKEFVGDAKEAASKAFDVASEKAADFAEDAKEVLGNVTEKAGDFAEDAGEKLADFAGDAKEEILPLLVLLCFLVYPQFVYTSSHQ